jgi:hypothetical protein
MMLLRGGGGDGDHDNEERMDADCDDAYGDNVNPDDRNGRPP